MSSFNKIMIIGYLGRDPEARFTPQGTPVTDFSIATTERRKDKSGEYQDSTTWFRVSLFGKPAERAVDHLKKGSLIYVEGALTQREYTDKDGAARSSLDVRGSDWHFVGPSAEKVKAAAAAAVERMES
jgi:single-strand DNA-binding protein